MELVRGLEPARTLDVACGTGFLTRHLRGLVVGLDQSPSMIEIAQHRLPDGVAIVGDSLALPFAAGSFDRVFTGHFYGHLVADEREAFLAEAARVAAEIVVVDSARRPGLPAEEYQERVLKDGSRHRVFKRYLGADELAAELHGEVLLRGTWFVAARAALTAAGLASGTTQRGAARRRRRRPRPSGCSGSAPSRPPGRTACRRCAPAPRSPAAAAAPCGTSGRWSSR